MQKGIPYTNYLIGLIQQKYVCSVVGHMIHLAKLGVVKADRYGENLPLPTLLGIIF